MAVPYVPYDGPIVTRDEAIAAGLKRYFTGAPCKANHLAERLVSSQQCKFCNYAYKPTGVPESWKPAKAVWKAANMELVRAIRRAGYQRRKAAELASAAAWRKANTEKSRAYVRNRRAKQAASEGKHTVADVKALIKLQNGKCAYCRKPFGKRHWVDHIQPVSKGGSNDRRNLQITCRSCNQRKSDIDPLMFAQRSGLLV
jgi:5-methylcytosine-specific restriction endonuclease McrA